MLHLAGVESKFSDGFEKAMVAVKSGKGIEKLETICKLTQRA